MRFGQQCWIRNALTPNAVMRENSDLDVIAELGVDEPDTRGSGGIFLETNNF